MDNSGYTPFFGKQTLKDLRSSDKSAKQAVVDKLAQAYQNNFFNRQEQQLADEIFRALVKDSDENIRQQLSDILKNNLLLPHDIVMALATDISDAVATPILENSYLLSEDDLTALINDTVSSPRLEAIARREALSAKVSSALLYKKLPQVMAMLFQNNGVQLDEEVVIKTLEAVPPSEDLMALVAQRREIGSISQQKLKVLAVKAGFTRFSQSLTEEELEPEDLVEAARLYSLLGMTIEQVKGEGMAQLVHQLGQEGRLSISLLLRSLCIGELALVEHALAQMAGVPVSNARILLRDKGGRGIAALYKASKMPIIYTNIFVELIRLLLTDTTLKSLHPRLLQNHLLIAIAEDESAEAIEFTTAIIKRATQDLENAEEQFGTNKPLAGGELPSY
ncbi:MAG: DUF2336 domain-containing protein [Rickettsiales bacterium]|nr:DUF2336 domain-containing protein [Rickettsiales bacterium]